MTEHREREVAQDSGNGAKKAYAAPTLVKHGTVIEKTLGGRGHGHDGAEFYSVYLCW
jgi:hypothetical protein